MRACVRVRAGGGLRETVEKNSQMVTLEDQLYDNNYLPTALYRCPLHSLSPSLSSSFPLSISPSPSLSLSLFHILHSYNLSDLR